MLSEPRDPDPEHDPQQTPPETPPRAPGEAPVEEIGGRDGPEPVRYGDWEKNGRCIDF